MNYIGNDPRKTNQSMPQGTFDTKISKYATKLLTTSVLTNSYQYTGTGAAIVHSILASNIDGTNDANVSVVINDASNGSNYFVARHVPVIANASLEMIKRPKVLKQNDLIKLQSDIGGDSHITISYVELDSDISLFNAFYAAGTAAVGTNVVAYTETNPAGSVIESILLSNIDGVNGCNTDVILQNGVDNPYLARLLNVADKTTIEICENPLVLNLGDSLEINVGNADRVHLQVHGRKI